MAMVTHFGMDAEREIHRGGTLAQADHLAFGGEHKHLLVKQVFLDRGEVVVVVVVAAFLLPIHQLPQPVEALGVTGGSRGTALFVFPVGGDAEFRHLMHFRGADLHLDRPMTTDHRRMQRLIAIGLGQADVVLKASRDRPERVVHHGQGPVAGFQTRRDDAHRCHVVDLVESLLLALHLAPDAIEMFGPTRHFTAVEPHRRQPITEQLEGDAQPLFPFTAFGGHFFLNFPEGIGLQQLEGKVFELPLEATDAQAVGQRCIDLTGFAGDALLLLRLEGTEGAHVVQTISELHQHHADVAGHGQKHLAQVFRLGFGAVGEMQPAQLGHPFHKGTHLRAEVPLQLLRGEIGVFHHVVEEAGGNHRGARADVAQQIGHRHGVNDVGVATGPELALMQLKSKIECRRQQGLGIGGAAVARSRRHVLKALPQPMRQLDAVVLDAANRMGANSGKASSGLRTDRIGLCRFCRRGALQHPTRQG